MKTAFLKTCIWLVVAIGISIISFSWHFNIFKHVSSLIEREHFEAFLNAQVAAIILTDEVSVSSEEPKMDSPDMAALQDYLMTIDPELKRVPKERLKDAYLQTKKLQQNQQLKSLKQLQWQEISSDMGGRVRAIMWDPNDPQMNKVWAGAVTGGLWYKEDITNENDNWIAVDDFWANLSISCITYDPNDPQTFMWEQVKLKRPLLFTGSSGSRFWNYESSDAGQTWELMPGTDEFEYVTDIEVRDENGTSVVYAAVASGVYKGAQHVSNPSDGLFRKEGETGEWEQVLPNISGMDVPCSISDIEIGADGRLYVGSMPNINGDGGATIFHSDLGIEGSWTINEEYKILIENTPDVNLPGRVIFAAAPSDPNRVLALIAQGYFYGIPGYECHILLRSDNKGESWQMIPKPPNSGSTGNWAYIAWHALTGAIDPNNPDRFYIGGLDIWRSDDAGETWSKKSYWTGLGNPNYLHGDHHRILFQKGSSDKVLFATDGGIFYSDSVSITYPAYQEVNQGFSTLQVYKCAIGPDPNQEFYLSGQQDNGTVYYDGNTITNSNRISGGDGGACFVDKNEPDVFITSHQNNQFYLFGNYQFVANAFSWQSGNFISSVDYDYKLNTIYANAGTVLNNFPDQLVRISGIPYGPLNGGYLSMGTGSTVPFTSVKYSEYSMLGQATLFLGTQSGRLFHVLPM
ncbi:MAG: sialidase family protein [Bacteroidales bacterium]